MTRRRRRRRERGTTWFDRLRWLIAILAPVWVFYIAVPWFTIVTRGVMYYYGVDDRWPDIFEFWFLVPVPFFVGFVSAFATGLIAPKDRFRSVLKIGFFFFLACGVVYAIDTMAAGHDLDVVIRIGAGFLGAILGAILVKLELEDG